MCNFFFGPPFEGDRTLFSEDRSPSAPLGQAGPGLGRLGVGMAGRGEDQSSQLT
jgi:hypothetical protein